MKNRLGYDVIIIGGSYAGLSAALSLGRSLRNILVIDSGNPCNKQTKHSHNFLSNDGKRPEKITKKAKKQVLKYPNINFISGIAEDVIIKNSGFEVITKKENYTAKIIVFATGVTDTIPLIDGFKECWGISILHCPYCHGYEMKGKKTGILGNGDMGYELAKIIYHWAGELTLYTNGTSTLNPEQVQKLNQHKIKVIENEVEAINHKKGVIKQILFKDTEPEDLNALYTKLPFTQQCTIPEKLGCKFTENGFIYIDECLETSIPGIYAAGDCLTLYRSIANAVASGNKVGAMINKKFLEEEF